MPLHDLSAFLLLEGALLAALVLAHLACVRRLGDIGVPRVLQPRIAIRTRLATPLLLVAALSMLSGLALWVGLATSR